VETLQRIRQIKKDLPVIVVTAHSSDDMVRRAEELGVSGIFRKGGSLNDLQSVIEEALKNSGREGGAS